MKTTIGEVKELIREAMSQQYETLRDLSREEAIAWLKQWAEGEILFKDQRNGSTNYATKHVDERHGNSFRLLKVPFTKDGVLLATDAEAYDPYNDGWTPIEEL